MTFFCNEKPHFFPNLSSFERVSASKKGLRQMVSQVLNHAAWTSKKGRAERRTSITEQFVTYITIIRLSFMQLSKQSRKNQFLKQFFVTLLLLVIIIWKMTQCMKIAKKISSQKLASELCYVRMFTKLTKCEF